MKLVSYLQKTKQVSRRDFKDMLDEQVMFVNNELVTSFDQEIQVTDKLKIKVSGGDSREQEIYKIPTSHPKLVLFNKPKGYVVSKKDPHNKIIYELFPPRWLAEYRYIGRLDKDSTGLLLLTNDTSLVDRYESPRNNIHKIYHVEIDKPLRTKDKVKIKKWFMVTADWNLQQDGKEPADLLSCVTLSYEKTSKGKHMLVMTLNEGKNRHIRRLLSALGYKIYKLHRLKVGKRHVDTLKPGKWRIEKASKRTKK